MSGSPLAWGSVNHFLRGVSSALHTEASRRCVQAHVVLDHGLRGVPSAPPSCASRSRWVGTSRLWPWGIAGSTGVSHHTPLPAVAPRRSWSDPEPAAPMLPPQLAPQRLQLAVPKGPLPYVVHTVFVPSLFTRVLAPGPQNPQSPGAVSSISGPTTPTSRHAAFPSSPLPEGLIPFSDWRGCERPHTVLLLRLPPKCVWTCTSWMGRHFPQPVWPGGAQRLHRTRAFECM